MRRAFLLAMAVVMAAGVGGLGGAARGAGEEGNGKVVKVDEGRKAKALELVKKAGMTDAAGKQRIRGDIGAVAGAIGAVAGAIGDEALLKSAVDDDPDQWGKVQIYTSAAHEQAARGDMVGAKKSVAAAVALLALPEEKGGAGGSVAEFGDHQVVQLQNVALAQGDVGNLTAAEATAARMPASTMQALVYVGLGVAEMKAGNSAPAAGDFDRAEAVLAGLSAEDHSMAWAMLADDEAKTNPERARKMLERMKDPMDQAARAAFIAGRFAQDGRVADARTFVAAAAALVNRAGGDPGAVSKRVGAESALAQAYGAIGDKKAGMEMLGKAAAGIAAEKNPSSLELLDLAIAEDRLGQTDDSDQTLAKVIDALPSDEKERTHVLWLMSEMLAFRGDVWDAADFIDKARVAHLGEEDAVYACVTAESLAKSDGEDAKLEWIDQMKDQAGAVIQRELYASAARGMVEAGENPKVRRFEAMAAAGDAEAMARLGAIFDAGLGVAKDMTAARSWYQKAAGAKDTEAADWLKAHPE